MIDAPPRSSLKQATGNAVRGLAELSRSLTSYLGLALLVAIGVVSTLPELRAEAQRLHASMLVSSAPAPVETAAAVVVAPVAPIPVGAHGDTVAFLESMGDGMPAEKLPVVHVSPAQVESLGRYITRKYRVSTEATRMLISTAYGVGQEMGIDPLLLLAIMAIESSFNPFAESQVGAQGLMQVLTKVHVDKFETFGGQQAAWNPVANIHVGALILKDCIARGGSLVAGLRMYVGSPPDGESLYGDKVLAERRRLASAAGLRIDTPPKPVQRAAAADPVPTPPAVNQATVVTVM